MFTGIVEHQGSISEVQHTRAGGAIVRVDAGNLARKLRKGDSIAVDGVCLTVRSRRASRIEMDLARETVDRTNWKHRKKGDRVNLELPITAHTLMSGHFVQGHVEDIAEVERLVRKGREDVRLRLILPVNLLPYCAPKGSIALNGVSLTIASLKAKTLEVALIPVTLQKTNLGDLKPGDKVNVETDILGRYIVRALKKDYSGSLN